VDKIAANFFAGLDSDQDGVITAENMHLEGVPLEVLKLSKPLLQEIEDLNLRVDLSLFVGAFRQFFTRQDLTSRQVFLRLARRTALEEKDGRGRTLPA
jgi:hypothetical protein